MSVVKTSSVENIAGTKYIDGVDFVRGTARAFCYVTLSGTTPTIQRECNVLSVTYVSIGTYDITFKNTFRSPTYGIAGHSGVNQANTAQITQPYVFLETARVGKATNKCRINIVNENGGALVNPNRFALYFVGD
jgi:hypothetical protein